MVLGGEEAWGMSVPLTELVRAACPHLWSVCVVLGRSWTLTGWKREKTGRKRAMKGSNRNQAPGDKFCPQSPRGRVLFPVSMGTSLSLVGTWGPVTSVLGGVRYPYYGTDVQTAICASSLPLETWPDRPGPSWPPRGWRGTQGQTSLSPPCPPGT